MSLRPLVALAMLSLALPGARAADKQPFDLAGPGLDITVTRGSETLPLSQLPGLAAGDRLRIKPVLPAGDAAKYVMVTAFLRGSTNPPPEDWFRRCDTWRRECLDKGLDLEVPQDAVQMVLLFAPKTGGDYKTLVRTVQGRPGAFVRASQELFQFSLDRMRLERYVAELNALGQAQPERVKDVAPLLARSLGIKVDEKCLDKLPGLQVPCLTQAESSMVLADGHDPSLVTTLTSGPASDLAMQVGNTRALSSGAYLPYISSLMSIARLMDNFNSARYQYIPALTHPEGSRLTLMLNTPPSFHEPQSVLVAALPPIGEARLPVLRNPDPMKAVCLHDRPAVLPLAGGSLLFGAAFARDMVLQVEPTGAPARALPVQADGQAGGLRVDQADLGKLAFSATRPAVLRGRWGFDALEGPTYRIGPQALDATWQLAPEDAASLVVGHEATLHLTGGDASCLAGLKAFDGVDQVIPASWSVDASGQLVARVDLRAAQGGGVKLVFDYDGPQAVQTLALRSFSDPGKLDGFELHVGESTGLLRGSRLQLVKALRIGAAVFEPPPQGVLPAGAESLAMSLREGGALPEGAAGTPLRASIELRDGRSVALLTRLLPSRPRASLIGSSIEDPTNTDVLRFTLAGAASMRPEGTLTFSVRLEGNARFGPRDAVEVATEDGVVSTSFTPANGLVLSSAQGAVVTLKPAAQLGPTAFGPIRFRVVTGGQQSEWQRLGVLVRTPPLKRLGCAADGIGHCELDGEQLYLIQSIADNEGFVDAVEVPEGFTARRLSVPHPKQGKLYVRLRDDPGSVSVLEPASPPP